MLDAAFRPKRRWRPTRSRLLITGLVIVTAVLAVLWVQAYSAERQFDRYRGCLPVCTGADISETTASVVDTGSISGKYHSYWLDVGGLGTGVDRVMMAGRGGVWPLVEPGDTVMIVYWRTTPVEVRFRDVVSQTREHPQVKAAGALAGLIFSTTVLLALVGRAVLIRRFGRGLAVHAIPFSVLLGGLPYAIWVSVVKKTVFYPIPLVVAGVGVVVAATMLITGAWTPWRRAERSGARLGWRR